MKRVVHFILWTILIVGFWVVVAIVQSKGTELRVPVKGLNCYDGDTFFVQVPAFITNLPPGVEIDGVEKAASEVEPFIIKIRLVDNHRRGKTRPASAPEIKTPSGRAQKGAIQARNRLTELVTGHEGVIIINLDMMKTKRGETYNLARLLTLDRLLADFQANGKKSTAGETLFREDLVKEWSKK